MTRQGQAVFGHCTSVDDTRFAFLLQSLTTFCIVATTADASANPTTEARQQEDRGIITHHDDSIDEMASQLLDDTTMDQIYTHPGNRMSQISISKAIPHLPLSESPGQAPPRLPQFAFNDDAAWALRQPALVTTDGMVKEMSSSGSSRALSPPFDIGHPSHRRKSSAPSLPPKSSKRRPGLPSRASCNLRAEYESRGREGQPGQTDSSKVIPQKLISVPQAQISSTAGIDIQKKIDSLMALSTPKPMDPSGCSQNPSRPRGDNYFTKIKKSINFKKLFDHSEAKTNTPDVSIQSLATRVGRS